MRDIFIDANIASKFAVPPNDEYKDLIRWLIRNNTENPDENAVLMLSDKLLNEYRAGNIGCCKNTSIAVLVNIVLAQNRFKKIETSDLKNFIQKFITKQIQRNVITCNKKDWWHFPLVFYSKRKVAIVEDKKFLADLLSFPKFGKNVIVMDSPKKELYL